MPCCEKPTVFKCCGVAVPVIFARLDPCAFVSVVACTDIHCNMCTGECECCSKTIKMYPCVTVEWASDQKATAPAPQSMTR